MNDVDVLVAGELNADLILTGHDSFPEKGVEVLAESMELTMGSASAIFACHLSRLGPDVGFHGVLGTDHFGDLVLDHLSRAGVDTSGVVEREDTRTGLTVVLSGADEYSMVTYPGAMAEWTWEDLDHERLGRGEHLHFASYYLQPAFRSDCDRLFRQAKESGQSTSFDPGWDPSGEWGDDIFDVLEHVDVLLPNESEALRITGTDSLDEAVERLSSYCSVVVVTRGEQGTLSRAGDERLKTGIFEVETVDTTGAGDSFNAGFIYRWLEGDDLQDCLRFGSASAALSTRRAGGAPSAPDAEEVRTFLEEHPHNQIVSDV